MLKIIIGGDMVPTKSNIRHFEVGDTETLIGHHLTEFLRKADFTIFNLEVPLTDRESPIEKCGPNLIASVSTINGLKNINPYFFTLANNHILDQGEQGLFSTMQTLDNAGIAYAGAGTNLAEAQKPYIYTNDGLKIGIYCCAEHEFSIASESTAGANPFDPLESLDHIHELKEQCDYVVVLYHGGKEHYRYPSPYLQKVCRKMVDKGADLVVCQHSHCIGCEEKWGSGIIVYGQGNFLFDDSKSIFWQTSLLIGLYIQRTNGKYVGKIQYIPLRKNGEKVRIAEKDDALLILEEFQKRSVEILDEDFVGSSYEQFAATKKAEYLSAFAGRLPKRLIYRIINKLSGYRFSGWFLSHKYIREDKVRLWNFIKCEAHRELLLQSIYGGKAK